MLRSRLTEAGVAAAIMFGVALSGSSVLQPEVAAADQAPSNQIAIEMGDFYITPSDVVVRANEPVEFVTANVGELRHRVSFQLVGTEERTDLPTANPAEATTAAMTFTVPGTYEMFCPFTGGGIDHRANGMLGTLTVS